MVVCPKCGKPSKGLCVECYLEDNPLQLAETKVYCCSCGRIRFRDRWDSTLEDVRASAAKAVKPSSDVRVGKVDVRPAIVDGRLILDFDVEGSYRGAGFKKTLNSTTLVQKTTCPECSRRSGGYFEAILQFRCPLPDFPLDDRQVAKVERVRGGVDYYVLSNNYAKGFASQLKRRGYAVKPSEKVFSRRDGREVYRVSYSIKEKKPST